MELNRVLIVDDDPAIRRVVSALQLDELRACAALRSDPELAGTRVLVLTGRDQPDDRAAARDAYLVKAFSSLALLEAVKRLTDG
jgi:CheY-like chemotaxis protein